MSSARTSAPLGLEQSIAVFVNTGRHPHRLVNAKPDEPAVEQVVIELLHQLSLRPVRIERCSRSARSNAQVRSKADASRIAWKILSSAARPRSEHPGPEQRVLPEPALKVHIGKQFTVRSSEPRIGASHNYHATNHIRNALSGGFFSGLLEDAGRLSHQRTASGFHSVARKITMFPWFISPWDVARLSGSSAAYGVPPPSHRFHLSKSHFRRGTSCGQVNEKIPPRRRHSSTRDVYDNQCVPRQHVRNVAEQLGNPLA